MGTPTPNPTFFFHALCTALCVGQNDSKHFWSQKYTVVSPECVVRAWVGALWVSVLSCVLCACVCVGCCVRAYVCVRALFVCARVFTSAQMHVPRPWAAAHSGGW